jgi:excisionase family DNA binding protein
MRRSSTPPLPKLYPLDMAAEALSVSTSTVRRLITDGKLKANKIGGQLRISATELQRFIGASIVAPEHCAEFETLDAR